MANRSAMDDADFKAAVSAVHAEFLQSFRAQQHAQAIRAHLLIVETAPGVTLSWAEEAARVNRSLAQKPSASAKALRETFSKQFNKWCALFPTVFTKFIEGLCRLRAELGWTKAEVEKALPQLSEECRKWAIVACDGESARIPWRAPGWLAQWPDETVLPTSALWERLDSGPTAEFVARLESQFGCRVDDAIRLALDQARVLIAEQEEFARRVAAHSRGKALPEPAKKLPPKQTDLLNYFDAANLTDIQRTAISLTLEYGLPVNVIARRLGKHRSTVQENIAAAKRKLQLSHFKEQREKNRAKFRPEGDV
jgi:hypothetical protein